jgi:uncharacterized protein YfdQ (DUF2303 family)
MEQNMEAVIAAARLSDKAILLKSVGTVEFWALPTTTGPTLIKIDIEATLGAPMRARGTVEVFDAASFSTILDQNQACGDLTVYVNRDAAAPAIVAVLNGNGPDGPGWGDFRVQIAFRPTPQWKKWKAIDGQMMQQAAFAEFVEDNLEDVVDPAGATMLEIATYLQTTRTTHFKSGLRLSSGAVQFRHEQSDDAKVGAGALEVPETIMLALAPVFGLPPYRIPARFRYRLNDGRLTLGIKMQRIDDLMATIVNEMVFGAPATEERVAVPGIGLPEGAVIVDGVAPVALK